MNRFYLKEFHFFDGDTTVVFNIVALYDGSDKITVAVTRNGKITVADYDLYSAKTDRTSSTAERVGSIST